MKIRTLAVLAGVAALSAGCQDKNRDTRETTVSGRTTDTRTTTADTAQRAGSDSAFIRDAGIINKAEVTLGDMALRKTQNQDVRRFAQMMVDDHSRANQELMSLARSQNLTVPDALDTEHQQLVNKLQNLSGAEFDREFMNAMVEGHQKAISKFENEARSGNDAQTKSWAAQTLPTLRQHLQHAREVQSRVAGNAGETRGINEPMPDSMNTTDNSKKLHNHDMPNDASKDIGRDQTPR